MDMTSKNWRRTLQVTLRLTLCLMITACFKGPSFLKQSNASIESTSLAARIQSDAGGVLTAVVSASSNQSQVVAASAGSAISDAQVLFPVGALAIDTSITIEEGASIANASFTTELNSSDAPQVSSAGSPVVVTSSVPMDAASPFTLAIPMSGNSLRLTADDNSLIVVIYKVYKAANDKIVAGVIPNNELTIADGVVKFDTRHFGIYQAALADRPVTKKVEAVTTAPILTKAEETKLPEINWKNVTATYNTSTRALALVASAENLSPTRCTAVFDKDKDLPWDHVEDTDAKLSFRMTVPNDVDGVYYVALECGDKNGRVSQSSWSNGITINRITSTGTPNSPPSMSLIDSIPSADETNVSRSTSITATFANNILIQASTINNGLSLRNTSANRTISGGMSYVQNALTFTPSEKLALSANYEVTLANTVISTMGNQAQPTDWQFSTADGDWQNVPDSVLSNTASMQTKFAFSDSGRAIMIYFDESGSAGSQKYYARYFDGSNWSNSEFLTDDTNAYVLPLIDAAGNGYAVWSELQPSAGQYISYIRIKTHAASGTAWSGSTNVTALNPTSDPGADYIAEFLATISPAGEIGVMWSESQAGTSKIMLRIKNSTGWTNPDVIHVTSDSCVALQLKIAKNRRAIASWYEQSADEIHASYYNGSSWSADQKINDVAAGNVNLPAYDAYAVQTLINDAGDPLIVWVELDIGSISGYMWALKSRRANNSGAWEPTSVLIDYSSYDLNYHRASQGPGGETMLTWTKVINGATQIRYSILHGGSSVWENPENVPHGVEPEGESLSLAYSISGKAVMSWRSQGSPADYYSAYFNGTNWGAAENMGPLDADCNIFRSTIDQSGNATTFWVEKSGSSPTYDFEVKSARMLGSPGSGWSAAASIYSYTGADSSPYCAIYPFFQENMRGSMPAGPASPQTISTQGEIMLLIQSDITGPAYGQTESIIFD